jgi:hypothetical protein
MSRGRLSGSGVGGSGAGSAVEQAFGRAGVVMMEEDDQTGTGPGA